MMSLTILALILSAITANMGALHSAQASADEASYANDIMRHVAEKIQAADFNDLGQAGSWAEPRYLSDGAGNPNAGIGPQQLQDWGLISYTCPLPNVEVFLEYYRGLNATADGTHLSTYGGNGRGLMQFEDESEADYLRRAPGHLLDNGAGDDGTGFPISSYRLDDAAEIRAVGKDPILIRVVIRWGDNADPQQRRRFQMLTARTADPGRVD